MVITAVTFMSSPYPFMFFRVNAGEAERHASGLVKLYHDVYEGTYPINEIKFERLVKKMLEEDTHLWWVAVDRDRDRIASACAGMPNHWNKTFESCRAATHPDYSGKSYRLAESLYSLCLREIIRHRNAEMVVSYLRTKGMTDIMKFGAHPVAIVGSDLGKHIVRHRREVHLMGLLVNPLRDDIVRVEPPEGSFANYDFVRSEILRGMNFPKIVKAAYPSNILVGPEMDDKFTFEGIMLNYGYIELSKSLEIRCMKHETSVMPEKLARAVAGLIGSFDGKAEYASLYILVDKTSYADVLMSIGFEVAAYLPGWFEMGGMRYDALKMTKRSGNEEMAYHGIKEIAEKFRKGLN